MTEIRFFNKEDLDKFCASGVCSHPTGTADQLYWLKKMRHLLLNEVANWLPNAAILEVVNTVYVHSQYTNLCAIPDGVGIDKNGKNFIILCLLAPPNFGDSMRMIYDLMVVGVEYGYFATLTNNHKFTITCQHLHEMIMPCSKVRLLVDLADYWRDM